MSDTHRSLSGSQDMLKRRLEILELLNTQTLWKKKASQRFEVSVQTIGRDIDALHQDGLLTYTLTEAEGDHRNHFVGFYTTDKGERALQDYLICPDCGDVAQPGRDCIHDYQPIPNGGGE